MGSIWINRTNFPYINLFLLILFTIFRATYTDSEDVGRHLSEDFAFLAGNSACLIEPKSKD